MNNNKSRANIHKMESNLREILGESFYNEIKEFYKKFIGINIDKVLITRRSYVLYKIFCMIFLASMDPEDAEIKEILKKGTQRVYTSHSLPLVLAKKDDKSLLIVDDIIVNGRTILDVIHKFGGEHSEWKLTVWCLRCNAKATFLDELKNYLKHVIYISPYEWEMVSDRLTDAVVVSNVGYVSFLQTYWITENLYNSFLKKFSQEIGAKKQFVQEAKIIDTNSKNNERKKSLICNYFLLEKGQYNNDYLAAIRLYKMESSYLAVPYIFLSSLKSEELLSLCEKIQNYRAFPQTENVRSLVQYFAQNWTASEIESCQDVGVFIYQAVVNLLSDKIFYEIVCEIGMGNIADDIELCFDSRESFEVQEERKENLESLHDLICHSTHSPTQLLSFNQYMKEGVKPSKNSDIPSDISYCERTLANSRDKNGTFLDTMKRYFTVLRKDDNIRAKGQQHRLYGIPVDKIVKCFAPAVADHSFSKVAPYYMDLIYLWDTGLATCVILPNINQTNDMLAFSEVIRHGEQAFRAIYSIYPNEYSILRRYASVTDSYTRAEILPFAKWCTVCYPTLKMMEFLNKIEFEAFFSDCIAVLPDSVRATLCDEEIDEMIDCYRNRN